MSLRIARKNPLNWAICFPIHWAQKEAASILTHTTLVQLCPVHQLPFSRPAPTGWAKPSPANPKTSQTYQEGSKPKISFLHLLFHVNIYFQNCSFYHWSLENKWFVFNSSLTMAIHAPSRKMVYLIKCIWCYFWTQDTKQHLHGLQVLFLQ